MLADAVVVGAQVQHQFRTLQSEVAAGRYRGPKIFADLHTEGVSTRAEELTTSDRRSMSGKIDRHVGQVEARSEPSLFVELLIVGQVALGHQSEESSFESNGGAVVESTPVLHRNAHHRNDIELTCSLQQLHISQFGGFQQGFLEEKVLTRVGCHRQFREADHLHTLFTSRIDLRQNLFDVVFAVGHLHSRYGGRHFHISVIHDGSNLAFHQCRPGVVISRPRQLPR